MPVFPWKTTVGSGLVVCLQEPSASWDRAAWVVQRRRSAVAMLGVAHKDELIGHAIRSRCARPSPSRSSPAPWSCCTTVHFQRFVSGIVTPSNASPIRHSVRRRRGDTVPSPRHLPVSCMAGVALMCRSRGITCSANSHFDFMTFACALLPTRNIPRKWPYPAVCMSCASHSVT